MRTRLALVILGVVLAVALIAITSNRGGGGTAVMQTVRDEHPQAASERTPQLTPLQASATATQPSSAPAIALARPEPPPSESQPADELALPTTEPADSASASKPTTQPVVSIRPSAFETECRQVQAAIETDEASPRSDLLAVYSRTAAGSGKFRLAAAACALFLDEFGDSHPQAARIAVRMGDCLAPLDMNNIEIADGEDGPRFHPRWQSARNPNTEQLYQAIAAYERAVAIAGDETQQAEALVKLGWVYRALNDWKTSTEVWNRCAEQASHLRGGQDALFLAAENLALTGQNQAAAERLNRLAALDPDMPWAKAAKQRAESLMTTNREDMK